MTTSSGKHLEDISHAHIVSLMYKQLTSAEDTDNLSTGFDRDRNSRQRELTNNKKHKGKYDLRIYLWDNFNFAEHQEKATYGLAYKLTLTRKTDNSVFNKVNATNIAKIKNNSIEWYVPHYTPYSPKQTKLSKQFLSKTPTELQYEEQSVLWKKQILRNYGLVN